MVNIIRLVIPLMCLRGRKRQNKKTRRRHQRRDARSFFFFPPALKLFFFQGHLVLPAQRTIGPHYQRFLAAPWLIVSSGELNFTFNSFTQSAALGFCFGASCHSRGGGQGVPERRVGGLVQGFVPEEGGAGRSHVVGQVGGDVLGGRSAKQLQPLLQDLLPTLQRLQHGVTQRRGHGQVCERRRRRRRQGKWGEKRARANKRHNGIRLGNTGCSEAAPVDIPDAIIRQSVSSASRPFTH